MASSHQSIQNLPGMSLTHAAALAQLGLTTTEQLYRYGQLPDHRRQLAQTLQVPPRYIAKWMALAELAQVPTVGCEFSGLLLHAGILSTSQLAETTPQRLYTQIRRLHVKTLQRADLCPTPDQVSGWIQNARAIKNGEAGSSHLHLPGD